jgi:hypothetical protein
MLLTLHIYAPYGTYLCSLRYIFMLLTLHIYAPYGTYLCSLRYTFMLLTVHIYAPYGTYLCSLRLTATRRVGLTQVTYECPLSSKEIRNFRAEDRSRPDTANSGANRGRDNNYNSCEIVGKLQAERTIQYLTGCSQILKKMYLFVSRRYGTVTSCYETAGEPVLQQDCD